MRSRQSRLVQKGGISFIFISARWKKKYFVGRCQLLRAMPCALRQTARSREIFVLVRECLCFMWPLLRGRRFRWCARDATELSIAECECDDRFCTFYTSFFLSLLRRRFIGMPWPTTDVFVWKLCFEFVKACCRIYFSDTRNDYVMRAFYPLLLLSFFHFFEFVIFFIVVKWGGIFIRHFNRMSQLIQSSGSIDTLLQISARQLHLHLLC